MPVIGSIAGSSARAYGKTSIPPIQYVQTTYNGTGTSATLAVTFTNKPAVGNTLILGLHAGSSNTYSSITDAAGNTWNLDASQTASGPNVYLLSCQVVSPYPSSGTCITLNTSSTGAKHLYMIETTGMSRSATPMNNSVLYKTTSNVGGTGTNLNLNAKNASDFTVCIVGCSGSNINITPDTNTVLSWVTSISQTNSDSAFAYNWRQPTSGAVTPGWNFSSNNIANGISATYSIIK